MIEIPLSLHDSIHLDEDQFLEEDNANNIHLHQKEFDPIVFFSLLPIPGKRKDDWVDGQRVVLHLLQLLLL